MQYSVVYCMHSLLLAYLNVHSRRNRSTVHALFNYINTYLSVGIFTPVCQLHIKAFHVWLVLVTELGVWGGCLLEEPPQLLHCPHQLLTFLLKVCSLALQDSSISLSNITYWTSVCRAIKLSYGYLLKILLGYLNFSMFLNMELFEHFMHVPWAFNGKFKMYTHTQYIHTGWKYMHVNSIWTIYLVEISQFLIGLQFLPELFIRLNLVVMSLENNKI